LSLVVSLPALAQAEDSKGAEFVRSLDRMMVQLAPQSRRDSRTIREAYKNHLDLLVLDRYADLEGALVNGGLAMVPGDPLRFNLAPRLSGPSPIGEKDLVNQISYIAARPATIGCLIEVASQVKSGPLEVTSLVRHTEYQGALKKTNTNATTSVPMHTMGLAFDIALVNTPLETVYEIRDVLRRMRNDGRILFIGERKQLVFHVVPHPSSLGSFNQVYARALHAPAVLNGTHVVAFSTAPDVRATKGTPRVTAEVVAVFPTGDFLDEWWAGDHAHGDVDVHVSPIARRAQALPPPREVEPFGGTAVLAAQLFAMMSALLGTWWRVATGRSAPSRSLLRDHFLDEQHA
jgi:hypothetical protein